MAIAFENRPHSHDWTTRFRILDVGSKMKRLKGRKSIAGTALHKKSLCKALSRLGENSTPKEFANSSPGVSYPGEQVG